MEREQIDHDEVTGVTLYLAHDPDPMNPLDFDSGFIMAALHHRYVNPAESLGLTTVEAITAKEAACVAGAEPFAAYPLFLYDHSGTVYSVGARITAAGASGPNPFGTGDHARFDSGRLGTLFVPLDFADVDAAAANLCDTYTDYANGNGFGYQVEGADGEDLDSCWGFYGSEAEYGRGEAVAAFARAVVAAGRAKADARTLALAKGRELRAARRVLARDIRATCAAAQAGGFTVPESILGAMRSALAGLRTDSLAAYQAARA